MHWAAATYTWMTTIHGDYCLISIILLSAVITFSLMWLFQSPDLIGYELLEFKADSALFRFEVLAVDCIVIGYEFWFWSHNNFFRNCKKGLFLFKFEVLLLIVSCLQLVMKLMHWQDNGIFFCYSTDLRNPFLPTVWWAEGTSSNRADITGCLSGSRALYSCKCCLVSHYSLTWFQ